MTAWTPVWRVRANGDTVTGVTLANLTITSGRTDINSPTPAGYCSLQLINTDNSVYSFAVNTSILIEVQDSNGDYVPLFGGRIFRYSPNRHKRRIKGRSHNNQHHSHRSFNQTSTGDL